MEMSGPFFLRYCCYLSEIFDNLTCATFVDNNIDAAGILAIDLGALQIEPAGIAGRNNRIGGNACKCGHVLFDPLNIGLDAVIEIARLAGGAGLAQIGPTLAIGNLGRLSDIGARNGPGGISGIANNPPRLGKHSAPHNQGSHELTTK